MAEARRSVHRWIAITLLAAVIGVAVGLGAYTFLYAKGYSYLTNNPSACANCHVMQAQYDAWMKSSHHSVATCNDCHTPHNLIGKYAVKANNGFWHSFYHWSEKPRPFRAGMKATFRTESSVARCTP